MVLRKDDNGIVFYDVDSGDIFSVTSHPFLDGNGRVGILLITLFFVSTVSAGVKRLEECGILVRTNNASRNRVFAYEGYLSILRKDT